MGEAKSIRGRFAPSPSGRMHLGNAFTALLAWLDVRSVGGELLLRMEDLDRQRCRPAYMEQLADDLQWMGLDWDFGWTEHTAEFSQSQRTAYYDAAFQTLQKLAYPCYCTRKELHSIMNAPHTTDGQTIYGGRCRTLTPADRVLLEQNGRRPAWRIRVPERELSFWDGLYGSYRERLDTDCGDFILRRSDGLYAYQLAVTADDGRMGVNRVVRGRDLLSSTPRQIWLMEQLGYEPPTYCHVPMLLSVDGRRLSKRDGDLDLGVLRTHTTPEQLIGFLAYLTGLIEKPEAVTAQELLPIFSWEKISPADRYVKPDDLNQLCHVC